MENVTNFIKIESNDKLEMSPEGDFFKVWVAFLEPVHELTKKEMEVLAAFLQERYELSKVITEPDVVDSALISEDTRKRIRDKCGISVKHLRVIMSKFRKNGVLVGNKIFLNLIPSITKDGAGLMVYFNFKKNEQHIRLGYKAGVKRA